MEIDVRRQLTSWLPYINRTFEDGESLAKFDEKTIFIDYLPLFFSRKRKLYCTITTNFANRTTTSPLHPLGYH